MLIEGGGILEILAKGTALVTAHKSGIEKVFEMIYLKLHTCRISQTTIHFHQIPVTPHHYWCLSEPPNLP